MARRLATASKLTFEEKEICINAKNVRAKKQNKVQYLMKQEPIGFTPVSNLTYLAHPRTIFHGCQIVPWYPLNAKTMFPKNNLFGLICENALLPWQPVMRFSRMGVHLQN